MLRKILLRDVPTAPFMYEFPGVHQPLETLGNEVVPIFEARNSYAGFI